jgi:hypothetical protein
VCKLSKIRASQKRQLKSRLKREATRVLRTNVNKSSQTLLGAAAAALFGLSAPRRSSPLAATGAPRLAAWPSMYTLNILGFQVNFTGAERELASRECQ